MLIMRQLYRISAPLCRGVFQKEAAVTQAFRPVLFLWGRKNGENRPEGLRYY
jgi:hypothetical protein